MPAGDAHISPEEIERAIYLDFEGFQETLPTLAGILCGDAFEQVVFDDALESAALATNCRVAYFDEEMRLVLSKCVKEKRRLVAYSQRERGACDLYAEVNFDAYYCDARKVAKRWLNSAGAGHLVEEWSLKEFLTLIRYPRPRNLGLQQTTSRLRYVREMLRRKGEYDALTPVAKAKWTRVLVHNQIDCEGMRELMRRTLSPFAAERDH